jgi:AcrR family transcriptional regulator
MPKTMEQLRPANVAKAEATRRGLIAAARKLFGEQGYAGTSVDEVVKAAGVTKGALYHHFRDKDDLFRAVVEEVKVDVTAAAAESYFDDSDSEDPLERVHRLVIALIDAHLDPAVQRISIIDARSVFDAATRRDLSTRYEASLLRGAFRGAMRVGTIEQQPLGPLAHIFAGALGEACALIAEADNTGAVRAEVTQVLIRLVDGLQPRA